MTELLLLLGAAMALTSAIVLVWAWRRRAVLERKLLADERAEIAAVLRRAGERAQTIIAEAEGVRADLRTNVAQAADKLVERLLAAYESELRSGMAGLQQRLAEAGTEEVKRLQERLARAEREAKKHLKERVEAALPKVIAQLAGKTIPLDVHEDLVKEAVEEAAAAGFFNAGHETEAHR